MGTINSFEKINYSLRPAKSIERKMILQFFTRLAPFSFIDSYHYIGFGSIYYSDFILFHKTLNIKKMSSIEFERNESRARFNLPFKCITLYPGDSNKMLSSLIQNDEKTIAWLDYDSPLKSNALDDIQTFSSKAYRGSVLLVTFNANSDDNECIGINIDAECKENNIDEDECIKMKMEKLFEYRKAKLGKRVSEKKIPNITSPQELNKKNLAKLYRKIVINEMDETLVKRNKTQEEGKKIIFKQIANFEYADNAKMMTLAFIFFNKEDEGRFNACRFHELDTYRENEESYVINAPKLTTDEIRALNKILPNDDDSYDIDGMQNKEFKKASKEYASVYQFFPQFTESLY